VLVGNTHSCKADQVKHISTL